MKKLLLGTSALIGATAMVASAQAAAPELTIGGNLDFRLEGGDNSAHDGRYVTQADIDAVIANNLVLAARATPGTAGTLPVAGDLIDNDGGTDIGGANAVNFANANSRSEIRFRAAGESDGGTSYGANIDYRYLASSTDEAYIYAGGGWGRVHLGQDDGALDQLVPNAGWIAPGAYLVDDTTTFIDMETFSTSDANKITYFSPDLGGFDFAITYGAGVSGSGATFSDMIEVAARYSTDWGDGGFTFGLGYQFADATSLTHQDLEEWVVGATISFGQFSLAASYNDSKDSGVRAPGGLANANAPATGREFFSFGIAYDIGGGMAVGLSYAEAEQAIHNGLDVDAQAASLTTGITAVERDILTLDFGFPIMEGMVGYAGVARTQQAGVTVTNAAVDLSAQDAVTYVIGTTVSF